MVYLKITPPSAGEKVSISNGVLNVPDHPIIPFIEGDGTGPDIWRASQKVLDAGVAKAYSGKRKIEWFEIYAGEKARDFYGVDCPPNYLPIDTLAIPKGKIEQVSETPFDFTKLTKIGSRINLDHEQLKNGFGYDHCFIFDNFNGNLKLNAILVDNKSGRIVEMFTTEPAVQLYTGNHLTEKFIGKKYHLKSVV